MRLRTLLLLSALASLHAGATWAQATGGAAGRNQPAGQDSRPARPPIRPGAMGAINSGDYIVGVNVAVTMTQAANGHVGDWMASNMQVIYGTELSLDEAIAARDALRPAAANLPPPSQIPLPSASAGTRPMTPFEQAQTATLEQIAAGSRARVAAATELVRITETLGDTEGAARARAMVEREGRDLHNLERVVQLSQAYDGRAFESEAAAQAYLLARERALDTVDAEYYAQRFNGNLDHNGFHGFAQEAADILHEHPFFLDSAQGEAFQARVDSIADTVDRNWERVQSHQTPLLTEAIDMSEAEAHRQFMRSVAANEMEYGSAPGTTRRHTIGEIPEAGTSGNGRTAGQAGGAQTASEAQAARAAARARLGLGGQAAEDNTPPRPVPTSPDYPTVSAEERARISREAAERRAARDAAANAAAAEQRAVQDAAAREAAERAAMVERARINDENHRLFLAAQRQAAQDNAWLQMVRARFGNGAWDAFADGRTVTTLQLESIYAGYDPLRAIPPAMSLSSAGMSLSSAGWSLSLAGTDWRDPALQSLYEAMGYFDYRRNSNPWQSGLDGDPARAAQMSYNAGPFDVRYNRDGRESLESGGYLAASLFDQEDRYLRELMANGLTGLDSLLAQPFNVILTWGAGANDLDLHMTGPLGASTNSRFHIYYAAAGDLQGQPFAQLIKDCICSSGSEVILTSALNRGGVYRVSVFNFGDQSAGSSNLSNASQAQIQIVRGGKTQSVGNGTTIIGGKTILTTSVPNGGQGNTWTAVELDPKNGRITVPRRIKQSGGSSGVD